MLVPMQPSTPPYPYLMHYTSPAPVHHTNPQQSYTVPSTHHHAVSCSSCSMLIIITPRIRAALLSNCQDTLSLPCPVLWKKHSRSQLIQPK
ncbi:hypothetical protein EJ05DRAFT_478274 [Pseudovirgaria hyperparasitica]|uniref:Uncharacterized protein n=1 Tax=Pseudovirgaria hyperparasitica TaxID=470096 RepID=A0A6A6W2S5_9PEZI|nr:uncharacterized protein EJ05DRAFT_478274 [Pseudovirgaria hyperparasitica]KAF2756260.1 hypothetical protein EJ05DRAFT_478274 [Pseudovirgaria hyperparasitica]